MNHQERKFKNIIERASLSIPKDYGDEPDRIDSGMFASVKEYLRVGGTYDKIADYMGMTVEQIKEIDETRYYIDFMKKEDERIIGAMMEADDE